MTRRPLLYLLLLALIGLTIGTALLRRGGWGDPAPAGPAASSAVTTGGIEPDPGVRSSRTTHMGKDSTAVRSHPASLKNAAPDRWRDLNAGQQQVLAPLQDDWAELLPSQRQKWLEVARRFDQLGNEERSRVQERMRDWARLTPTERGLARLNYQEARALSAQERLERWEAYQGLDEEQRRQLTDRALTSAQSPLGQRRSEPAAPSAKTHGLVPGPLESGSRAVGATTVQGPMGASTKLVSRLGQPTSNTPVIQAKVVAKPGLVDGATLLPLHQNMPQNPSQNLAQRAALSGNSGAQGAALANAAGAAVSAAESAAAADAQATAETSGLASGAGGSTSGTTPAAATTPTDN